LPGIGPYSAGAIASIAFGVPAPIVDGNVTRVLCRLFALSGDPSRRELKSELWKIAGALVPQDDASSFNQSLMELGATLCSPKQPDCSACPLARRCRAHATGSELRFPQARARPKITPVHMVAAVVERDRRVLVHQLPTDARRWAGMWQFPNAEIAGRERPEDALARAVRSAAGLDVVARGLIAVVRHGVTRYRITLDAYRCTTKSAPPQQRSALFWAKPSELETLAMPAAHRRIARALPTRSTAEED
jgi:A/G-specific adenine glycosylase